MLKLTNHYLTRSFASIVAIVIVTICLWRVFGSQKVEISAIIVPHHNLVQAQRQNFMRDVSSRTEQPQTIILISPNHYESGAAHIQTTEQAWTLSNGKIEPNISVLRAAESAGAHQESGSFDNEHGIRLILPDIKKYFPKSRIVPIIFKRTTTLTEITKLNDALKACQNCLLVASVDFSHYQPTQLASLHDDLTIRALDNVDTKALMTTAETDSPAALGFLSLWVESHQTSRFHLANHTNSGSILAQPNAETTSHLYGWYEKGNRFIPHSQVSFSIGGDMMFGRGVAHAFPGNKLTSSLDQLGERVFWGTDAAVINLEGPISPVPVPDNPDGNNLNFNFPPQTIQALKFLHINGANSANNHSLNAGSQGLEATRSLLKKAKIQPIGGGDSPNINITGKFTGQNLALYVIGVNEVNVVADPGTLIRQLKQDHKNRVMVFAHWGSEYATKHNADQAAQAHAWIDAGADIVVGSHPHVIQDGEVYKNRPIIYSLGNLLFDQTDQLSTTQGMILAGEFSAGSLKLFALPTQSINLKPQIAAEPTRQSLQDQFYDNFKNYLRSTSAGKELNFALN